MRYYLYLSLLFFFVLSAFTILLVLCVVGLLVVKYVKERRNG